MNLALINFSGNVGKSTIAYHLFKMNLDESYLIGVETINDSGNFHDIKVKAKDFPSIQNELLTNNNIILDIGSSNVEKTLEEMSKYDGSHEDIDLFIIPVPLEAKQHIDSMNTAIFLLSMGVESEKIKFVFNLIPPDTDVPLHFDLIYKFAQKSNLCSDIPVIFKSEYFEHPKIKNCEIGLKDLITKKAEIKASLKNAIDDNEKAEIVDLIALSRLSVSVEKNLTNAFNSILN